MPIYLARSCKTDDNNGASVKAGAEEARRKGAEKKNTRFELAGFLSSRGQHASLSIPPSPYPYFVCASSSSLIPAISSHQAHLSLSLLSSPPLPRPQVVQVERCAARARRSGSSMIPNADGRSAGRVLSASFATIN